MLNQTKMPKITNLNEFLEQYPWENEKTIIDLSLLEEEKLNFFWSFHLKSKPEELWDFLADTSSTNKALGLPPMEFREENGKLYGKAINAGILLEWEESPWQWEYLKYIKNQRIYSKGFAKYVRAMYIFEYDEKLKQTNLIIYFGWIPRNLSGKILLKIAMPNIQKKYGAYLKKLDEMIQQKNFNEISNIDLDPDTREKTLSKIYNLYEELNDETFKNYYKQIWEYLLKQNNDFLYRIRIKKIARDLNINFYKLLEFFLKSTQKGFFVLTYDIVCPHCKGVRKELKNLGEIPESDSCDVCQIDFDSTSFNNIEITFKIHPSILKVEKQFYCAAEPAKKPHILIQKIIPPHSSLDIELHFPYEIYRLRWLGEKKYIMIQIKKDGNQELVINEFFDDNNLYKELSSNALIKVMNNSNLEKEIILEHYKDDELILRPYELFNFQDYRDLFSENVLNTKIKLDIGIQYLMFIDMSSSTKIYLEKGDNFAFSLVKKFFEINYGFIKKNYGAVVKTMGDAIFASFPSEDLLLQCAIEIWYYFNSYKDIKIKIVLNKGKVLAVNLNTGIDYFGTPVNILAKMEKYLKEQEIAIPDIIYQKIKDKASHHLKNIQFLRTELLSFDNIKDQSFIFHIFGNI